MSDLTSKHCVPCGSDVEPFNASQAALYLKQVPGWRLKNVGNPPAGEAGAIERKFKFKNFKEALEFVNRVGEIAEGEGHHPDIEFGWGYAEIELSTHAIKGLSENDFILAAKINQISNIQ